MAYPQGMNFRSTSGYVTDGTGEDNETGQLAAGTYPRTSAQGNTVGWESAGSDHPTRNRSAANDRRLAGCSFTDTAAADFRFDLSSTGDKVLRCGIGDQAYSRANQKVEIFDTSSSLGTLFSGVSTGAANSFLDATGTARTNAAFNGSNASVTKTFSTTICRFRCGDGTNPTFVAHLYVEDGAAAGGHPTMKRWAGVPGMSQTNSIGRGW